MSLDTLSGTELPAQELAKHRTLERYFRAGTTKNVTGARITVYARDDVPCPDQESGGTDQL